MKTEFDNGVHIREGFCCLGTQWSCGHSQTCMYDKQWNYLHDKMHKWDDVPLIFFYFTCYLAFICWIFTR